MIRISRRTMLIVLSVLTLLGVACSETKTLTKPGLEEARPEASRPSDSSRPSADSTTTVAEAIHPAVEGLNREQIDMSSQRDTSQAASAETFPDVHFDYDRYNIRPQDEPTLKRIASWLVKNSGARLTIEGHCDERGTVEYNLALGERRASAIRDYLVSSGIDRKRITTISYGKERPLDTAQTEEAWAKNRRGHFIVQK